MKFYLFVFAFLLSASMVNAQSKSKSGSASTTSKNWGIGLRLGDPTGLTVKKYLANSKALEFNIGRSNWNHDYYDEFQHDNRYKNYDYINYDGRAALSIQAHLLWQKDFPNAKGLQWYWGVGPQVRVHNYTYNYRYDAGSDWVYVSEDITNVDFGFDGVIGLDYQIPKAPLSVFADANILTELFDDPFEFYFQGGIGIRYNF